MSISEERKRILKMVEAGTITAEEASQLLEALEASEEKAVAAPSKPKKARWLRIRIVEGGHEKPTINLKIPIGLIGLAKKIGGRFLPESEMKNLQEILDGLAADPEAGKFLEIVDHDDGDRVEIMVE